jgi:hypothetical protein
MNRAIRLAPLVGGLTGAGFGICLGMWFCDKPPYRVPLGQGMAAVWFGGVAGAMVGCAITATCARRPQLVRPLGLASVALLGAAAAAPLGWLAGTIEANQRLTSVDGTEWLQQLPRLWMLLGAGAGCVLGLSLGGVQLFLDRRRPTAPNLPPPHLT